MNRRDFVRLASVVSFGGGASVAGAQEERYYEDVKGPYPPNYRLYGSEPAEGEEEEAARRILSDAEKHSASFLAIARYMEGIKERNKDGELYNAQWEKRWNPVIVGFYQPGKVDRRLVYEEGDTIPWCAAFLAWALHTAGYREPSINASSGSFRGIGKPASNPVPGDIVVFQKANAKLAAVGRGHVGIFLEKGARNGRDGYMLLGGNQGQNEKGFSYVNSRFFPEKSSDLVLHSVRSLASLHRPT